MARAVEVGEPLIGVAAVAAQATGYRRGELAGRRYGEVRTAEAGEAGTSGGTEVVGGGHI